MEYQEGKSDNFDMGCLESKRTDHEHDQEFVNVEFEPTVISILDVDLKTYPNPALANARRGKVWVKTDSEIRLTDRTGTVHDSINLSFNIGDMAQTKEGIFILLLDWANNSVKSVSKDGELKTLCTSQSYPCGICCLSNGNFVVAFPDTKQVIQYNSEGELQKEFHKSLFRRPWFVAENQVNQHLYICDKSHYSQQTSLGRVQALDKHGELQYTYSGESPSDFVPMGICTDSTGSILIADYKKHCIHLLDKDGHFLQYVLSKEDGSMYPYAVVVDADGYGWVCSGNKKQIVVFQYRTK